MTSYRVPTAAKLAKGEQKLLEKLRAFQRAVSENRRCADCNDLGPTYVCMDFGTFICATCAGLHREVNHKVKGLGLSEFAESEVEFISTHGNAKAKAEFMKQYRDDLPIPAAGDVTKLRHWIKEKYIEKRWAVPVVETVEKSPGQKCGGVSNQLDSHHNQKGLKDDVVDLLGLSNGDSPNHPPQPGGGKKEFPDFAFLTSDPFRVGSPPNSPNLPNDLFFRANNPASDPFRPTDERATAGQPIFASGLVITDLMTTGGRHEGGQAQLAPPGDLSLLSASFPEPPSGGSYARTSPDGVQSSEQQSSEQQSSEQLAKKASALAQSLAMHQRYEGDPFSEITLEPGGLGQDLTAPPSPKMMMLVPKSQSTDDHQSLDILTRQVEAISHALDDHRAGQMSLPAGGPSDLSISNPSSSREAVEKADGGGLQFLSSGFRPAKDGSAGDDWPFTAKPSTCRMSSTPWDVLGTGDLLQNEEPAWAEFGEPPPFVGGDSAISASSAAATRAVASRRL